MGKKRTFKVGSDIYDIPTEEVDVFVKDTPKAIEVKSFLVDKDTFDIPVEEVEGFIKDMPDAKPLFEEEQPQEIPSITLDSTEVANGTADAPEWTGDAGTAKPEPITKQTRDVFMKHAGELPDKVKYDAKNSQIYINTFAKKLGVSPREMRKVYSDFIQNEAQLKELKRYYDQHPDDVDNLYKIAELHNAIGQHDLALEAYSALEGKLRKVGEAEALDPNNPNQRPDYVEQRVMPAIAGQAYTKWQMGDEKEARRLQALTGYQGQEFESVGAGETLQPGNEMVYNDQGQMVPVGSPTPESEYLNGIAQAIENFTLFGPASEMTNVGFDKVAKHLPGAFSAYGTPGKLSDAVGVITGGVETLMGVAGMTTPAGALFAMPLVEVQNVAPEVAEWMMPIGKVLREYYRQQGETMPELMENVTVLADLGMLGWLTHQGVEGAKGAKLEADFKKVFDKLPPEAVEQLAKAGEKRIEDAGGNIEQYGLDMEARMEELKPQVEEIKTQAQATEVEPYSPPPHPESLRTVEEGVSIVMNGEEGILERGDDGTWYHTTDNKSTQIKVEDKFNPTESLKDLGIEVLAEITPEQVARATADAEQVGRVEMNGKEYFVSLDRVGNENPTGDFVLEVKPDGTMINRFDSHPDPTFAKERKQKVINEFLKKNNLPPRKLTAKVESKPTQEQPSTSEIKPIENEKVNQEGREKRLLIEPTSTTDAVTSKVEALKDVESTAKALETTDKTIAEKIANTIGVTLNKKKAKIDVENNSAITSDGKQIKFKISSSTDSEIGQSFLTITAVDNNGQKVGYAKFIDKGKNNLEGSEVEVTQKNQKQGIASAIYSFADAKGYKVKESVLQTPEGRALWKSLNAKQGSVKSISEAYHKAKADGTNPKLVKAVEDLLQQKKEILPANEPVSPAVEVQKVEPVKVEVQENVQEKVQEKPTEVDQLVETSVEEYKQADPARQKEMVEIVKDQLEKNDNAEKSIGMGLDPVKVEAGKEFLKAVDIKVEEPVKITSKEKALKAVDDLEAFLMDLPGVKDNTGAERMGAPFKMEDAVKFFTKTLRESIEQGYKVKDAIERAIGKSKEKYSEMFNYISEEDLRAKARKQQEDAGNPLDKPVEQQFGASHASVAEVRKVMGLEDEVNISEYQKRDVKTVMSEGKKLAENTDIQELATEVNNLTRTLSAEEQAALVYEETRLYNESVKIEDDIMKLNNKGAFNESDQAMITLADVRRKQINVLNALDKAGSEMGLAFRMRQLMNKRDYSVVNLERRWTKATGVAEVPKAIRKEFEQKVKELEQENKKLEELNKAKEKQIADMALADLQEAMGRSKKTPQERIKAAKKARKEELAQKFRGVFNDVSNVIAAMADKEFYEYAKLVFEEAVGDFKEFSKRMVGDLGKNVEPHLQEIFDRASKKEYEKSYIDDKGIHIDNDLLLDIVEAGVKDSKDFLDKVEEVVKVDLPDVSRRQIADAVSGYGKQRNSTLPELVKELNSYKRDLKLESGLSDAQAKLGVKKSGASPPKPTDYQRGLQRQIREFLKDYPQDQAELTKKWATALDKTKSRLKNAITDNTKRIEDIKNGTAVPKTPKDKLKLDAEAEMLKEVNDDLKKQIEDLEGKKTLTDQQRVELAIAAAERTASKYEARTREIRATGTYTKDAPRTLSSPELDIARADRDAKREEYDQVLKDFKLDELEQASRELSASEKRVEALENKIKSNDISFAAKARNRLDYRNNPELAASLYKEKVLKDAIKTMREEQGLVEAREREMWHKRKERQIKDIQHRINTKDFAKKVPKEKVLDMEMEQVQRRLDRIKFDLDVKIEMERYKSIDGWEKFKENITDIVNIPKSMMASMDLSAPLRQGAILFARHPILGMKASKEMIKHLWSEREANAWHETLTSTDGYIRAKNAGLFISEPMAKLVAAEERFSSHLAEKIPLIGRGVKASNRAYSGFLNKMRVDVFNQHYDALVQERFTGKQLQNELNSMAHLINNFTGRGKLGKRGELASPLLNAAFFAPRFVTSRVNNLANALTGYYGEGRWWGKQKMTPRARIEAYKALSAYIGTGLAVLEMAKASGASVEADPRSSDFGKIKIGDLRYDIWAGHQQLVVLLSRIWSQASKDVRTGTVKPFDARSNTKTVAENFIRSKSSPQVGFIWSAMTGKTMGQEEFDAGKEVMRMSIPLLLQDPVIKLIYDDAVSMYSEGGAGLGTVVASGTGVGVNYIPPNPIMKDSNLDPSSEKLMLAKKYQPEKANDDEVYVDGEPYKIPEADMEKIKSLRSQKAGEKINEEYSTLQDLSDEEYASKVNSYYNNALKEARNEVLPDGWKNEK